MSALLQACELIVSVSEALGAPLAIGAEGGQLFGPSLPGHRKPRKPWRIGIDLEAFSAILQIEEIDAAWMPLAGGTQADGLEMLADSINAHVGLELTLRAGRRERLDGPDPAAARALIAWLAGGVQPWAAVATRLAAG